MINTSVSFGSSGVVRALSSSCSSVLQNGSVELGHGKGGGYEGAGGGDMLNQVIWLSPKDEMFVSVKETTALIPPQKSRGC